VQRGFRRLLTRYDGQGGLSEIYRQTAEARPASPAPPPG
jgi:hypothetical protein